MLISSPEGAAASADFAAVAFVGAFSGRSPLPPADDAHDSDHVGQFGRVGCVGCRVLRESQHRWLMGFI